jgi:protoporphyrin/coproporphyrin ferrochelatase
MGMKNTQPRVGVLLINLGTPAGPDKRSVRGYLAEFLSDPRVIDLPAPLRQLLVYGVILPFRPRTSAHAYRQIWTKDGSPLLLHSQQLAQSLSVALGATFTVELGMRYGQPDIATALQRLRERGCQKLLILPLFPQYSSAATGSALEKTLQELQKNTDIPAVSWINSFFDHPGFIQAWKSLITRHTPAEEPDMWIFSYHGLPVRHLDKSGCATSECLARGDCAGTDGDNYLCYRRQCFTTSRLLAEALGLPPSRYQVAFQSRLGRTPWITPYTDHLLTELAARGLKRIAIVCPSFVADCLETLEEIGIRARTQWHSLGGEHFHLIPCLNTDNEWIKALTEMIRSYENLCEVPVSA